MQVHVQLSVSITIPGTDQPVKIQQWVPVEVPTPKPAEPTSAAAPAKADTTAAKPAYRLKLAAHGSKFAPTPVEVDGTLCELPACVAQVLREVAGGNAKVRFRAETKAKLQAHLPWVLALLKPDASAKVIARRHQYIVQPELPPLIRLEE